MKKSFIILGFTSAIVAVILAATPLFKLSVAPIIIAFISGLIILFLSKKLKTKTKVIQYIFLLVIIALSLTIYKGLVNTSEIENTEQLEQIDKENKDENVGNFKETFEEREID
jgi:predicted PurR-regulated permease PerM